MMDKAIRKRSTATRWLLGIFLVFLLLSCGGGITGVLLIRGALNPYNDKKFDAKEWSETSPGSSERDPMAQDLIERHIHQGMTLQQIEAMLGPPSSKVNAPRNDNGLQIPGAYSYKYWLGTPPSMSWDDAFVYIHFDSSGIVLGADIHGY